MRLVGRIVRERSEQKLKRSPECIKAFQNLYAAAGNRFETSLSGDDQESIKLFQLCLKVCIVVVRFKILYSLAYS